MRGSQSRTKRRARSRTVATAVLASALGLGAGAPALAQDGPQTSGWESLGEVTLRIAGEEASKGTLDVLSAQFTKLYPNVTIQVDIKSFDDHMATVLLVADAPDAPDIIFGNQGYVTDSALVEAGLIIPLDAYYDAYGWHDWFGDGTKAQFRFSEDGRDFGAGPLWGISESADFVGVYYNVDKLAALGVEPPATFAGFVAALDAAKNAGELPMKVGNQEGWPAIHVFGIAQGATWPAEEQRAWVFGEAGADYSAEGNLEAARIFRGWVEAGYINDDANGLGYEQAWQEFAKGDGVFLPGGSWLAAGLRDSMGEDKVGFIAPPPGGSGKVAAVAALSLPFHISSRSANPDLAAAFIDFVMAPDKGQVYFDDGRIPAAAGAAGEPADPVTGALNEAWERIAHDDGLTYFQDWASDTMFDTLTSALQELVGGRTTPEDFVARVQADWTAFHASR